MDKVREVVVRNVVPGTGVGIGVIVGYVDAATVSGILRRTSIVRAMTENIINLARVTDDGVFQTPQDVLADALEHVQHNPDAFNKAVVILIDDRGSSYFVSVTVSGLTAPTLIAALDITKAKVTGRIIDLMGDNDG